MKNPGFLSVSLFVCLLLIAFIFPYRTNALHEPQGPATTPELPPGIKVGAKLVYMTTAGSSGEKLLSDEDIPSTVLEIRGQWYLIEDTSETNFKGGTKKSQRWLNADHIVWYRVEK